MLRLTFARNGKTPKTQTIFSQSLPMDLPIFRTCGEHTCRLFCICPQKESAEKIFLAFQPASRAESSKLPKIFLQPKTFPNRDSFGETLFIYSANKKILPTSTPKSNLRRPDSPRFSIKKYSENFKLYHAIFRLLFSEEISIARPRTRFMRRRKQPERRAKKIRTMPALKNAGAAPSCAPHLNSKVLFACLTLQKFAIISRVNLHALPSRRNMNYYISNHNLLLKDIYNACEILFY